MTGAYITASELADYIYCECCWADKLEGNYQQTAEMIKGINAHDTLHWQYQVIEFVKRVALVVVIGCGILFVLAVAIIFFFNR